MNVAESLIFYLVLGVAVGVATLTVAADGGACRRTARALAAVLFWPLFLPLLLSARGEPQEGQPAHARPPRDNLAVKIEQVNLELDAALSSLDGWAETALAREERRIAELKRTWQALAERIRAMEALLAGDTALRPATEKEADENDADPSFDQETRDESLRLSESARREHMAKLSGLHARSRRDLLATLAWVRELTAMIHLAKFSGAPASRAEELVAQIAAAVEGLTQVSHRTAQAL